MFNGVRLVWVLLFDGGVDDASNSVVDLQSGFGGVGSFRVAQEDGHDSIPVEGRNLAVHAPDDLRSTMEKSLIDLSREPVGLSANHCRRFSKIGVKHNRLCEFDSVVTEPEIVGLRNDRPIPRGPSCV